MFGIVYSNLNFDLNNISGLDFPSIIICNANRLKQSKANEYNMTLPLIRFMLMNLILLNGYFVQESDFSTMQEFIYWREMHNFSYFDIWDAIAPKCEDTFVVDVCNKLQVFPIETVEYGRCYQVELNRTIQIVGKFRTL
jgi:hypothetical protein